jgi:hypothetical protein
MSIFAIIKEALRIARTYKSLWVFGFLAGAGIGFNNGGGGGDQAGVPAAAAANPGVVALVVVVGIAVVIGLVILKFVSNGALIEGVKRARGNAPFTWREGFREGWAHWGVLLRIALLFVAVSAGSAVLLFGGCYLVVQALGMQSLFVAGPVAVVIAVPLFVTLQMWQAFAERIAVLENRRALDATAKARLFLHGRIGKGLKLVVASFLGVLTVVALALAVIAPVVLLLRASAGVWGLLPAVGIGVLIVLPTAFVAISMIGIMGSSVWTIGYLTEVER